MRQPSPDSVGSHDKSVMLEHVVEREQAPQEHFIGSGPAVAEVLGAERAVELPRPQIRQTRPMPLMPGTCLVGWPRLRSDHGPDEPKQPVQRCASVG